jgi:hypothetical protein
MVHCIAYNRIELILMAYGFLFSVFCLLPGDKLLLVRWLANL